MTSSDLAGGLGRRIVVSGASGSGKTTVARRLSQSLGLPVVELDAILHARGWNTVGPEELRERLRERLVGQPDGWVCDGNYRVLRPLTLTAADAVVWLHLPWRVRFWRLLKRSLGRVLSGRLLWGRGSEAGWRESLGRLQILWSSPARSQARGPRLRQDIEALSSRAVLYELRSAREIETFLRDVALAAARPSTGSG